MIEFRPLADGEPSLSYSPLLRGVLKTFAYAEEHGSIGLTPSKAFKRNFVHWAAREFDWPGHSEAELFAVNKVLNEQDFLPLVELHFLLTTLRLGRHYKGQFRMTKAGSTLSGQPGRLFGILTPFYLFEIDHAWAARGATDLLPGNWDMYLNIINIEATDGVTGHRLREVLFGPPAPAPWPVFDEVMSNLCLQVLRPLIWAGLLQKTQPDDTRSWQDAVFTRTPLWKAALQLETDSLVRPATRH